MEAVGAAALEARRDLIRHAAVVVADCNPSEAALAILCDLAHTLFVDCVSEVEALRIRKFLASAHTLKPNRAEATALTGMTVNDEASARDAIMWLLSQGVDRVFLTLGRDGAIWAGRNGESGRPGHDRAGDAFTAGLVSSHLSGHDSLDAARAAGDAAVRAAKSHGPVAG